MELEELEIYQDDLKQELRQVQRELQDLEEEEQVKELQHQLWELEMEKMELQLEELKIVEPKEAEAKLEKLDQAFFKVSTITCS